MTIRIGMTGDTVRRIEELLAVANLYNGPIDSSFGGGLESAVKNYQNLHHLAPSGLVDAATWAVMFPGQAMPVSPLAGVPLAERCLALTGSFETGKFHPDCFCGVTGDFDGMGISFGVLQWNVGQGSLQPILKQMFEDHTEVAQNIFHDHFDGVKALASDSIAEQLAFSRSIQAGGRVMEPWMGMLITLGRSPECQSVQAGQASKLYNQALQLCGQFSVSSERAAALMFDVVTQNGSIGSTEKAQILADYAKLPQDVPGLEVLRLQSVANRVADAARPQFVNDVRTRKLTIANGGGTVHGILYDLEDMFAISLKPFGTGVAAATAS